MISAVGSVFSADEIRLIAADDLAETTARLVSSGFQLLTLVGTDERATAAGFGIWVALHRAPDQTVLLRALLDPSLPAYPSITHRVPAVHWDEREAADLLGLVPDGHPDPRRLVMREDWPADLFPLRKDFDPGRVPPPSRTDSFPFTALEGEGIGHVPVGPIHAGIIEPGHFRFAAVGEMVLHLDARLFYTHRGIEKLVEGRTPDAALPVIERICGVCAFSHALSFSEAIESISGTEVPERARWARTLCLELERLYNHLGDAGNICAGTGFAVGAMRGARLKEKVQHWIEILVGHRFLRDVCTIGGLRRDLAPEALERLRVALPGLHAETRDFAALILGTESFLDRVRGTGVVAVELVRALGGVGVAARAAGLAVDARLDRPREWYRILEPRQITHSAGDVEARLRQRLAEADDSWRLVGELLKNPPSGPFRLAVDLPACRSVGIGVVESPRGANVHWVLLDAAGRIERLRVRSASFPNWPLVAAAAPGYLMPDFPLINKSFELCYACLDR